MIQGRGINNMNTMPMENIPFNKINSIGQQWIRRFALALSKETLGQVRGKFGGRSSNSGTSNAERLRPSHSSINRAGSVT